MVTDRTGVATPFAMITRQELGAFLIEPLAKVHAGLIEGENSSARGMKVTITKEM